MKIIVGLGNPGEKYQYTRHNIGFDILDTFKEKGDFFDFNFNKKFNAEISKNDGFILVKPMTYMNISGQAIGAICNYYNIEKKDLLVIHDDKDILVGQLKVDFNRSSAGHKGVESIINTLGGKDFWRIRFGIGKDSNKKAGEIALKRFDIDEANKVERAIEEAINEIRIGINEGFAKKSIKKES